jgi:hypothetical protein
MISPDLDFFALVETCQTRADLLGRLLLKISQILPQSPSQFRVVYLVDKINAETPWGLGGSLMELLGGVLDYCRLVVAWKICKMLIGVLGSRL